MDVAMNRNINQEKLNASLRMLDRMGQMSLERLKETDPLEAKRQEQMTLLFKDEDFLSQFMACDEKEEMIRVCADRGLAMTMEELDQMLAQLEDILKKLIENDGELSDEDLEMVAGGWSWMGAFLGLVSGICVGALAGWVFGNPVAGAIVGGIIGVIVGGNALD